MKFEFQKYQGTGNDFVIIDNRDGIFPVDDLEMVRAICSRRLGVGSDGLILLEKDAESDFYMNFFNPDASQSFCGNGSRCITQYALDNGIVSGKVSFRAIDGFHISEKVGDWIHLKMNDVSEIENGEAYAILDTGSPHYIERVNNAEEVDIIERAHQIRYSERFQKSGINVNFVEAISSKIKMRTYERGVEAETLSCGTGVTAAALAFALEKNVEKEVEVETKGGELKVTFERDGQGFKNIWLCGPAKKVFEGKIDVKR